MRTSRYSGPLAIAAASLSLGAGLSGGAVAEPARKRQPAPTPGKERELTALDAERIRLAEQKRARKAARQAKGTKGGA